MTYQLGILDVNSLLDVIPRLTKALESDKASSDIKITLSDVTVLPTALEARLMLSLSAPPQDTVIGTYLTRNGIGTNENFQYLRKSGTFIFQPGEPADQEIVITLKGNNKIGNTIDVVLSSTVSGGKIADSVGTIRFGTDTAVAPSGYIVAYASDFLDGFIATDTGLDANGVPCWQSRLVHGRTQSGNKEVGLYADPVIFAGTDPFPVVDGKRRLRSEMLATPITYEGTPWAYTAAAINSSKMKPLTVGDRVECRLAMRVAGKRGAWPAFWLLDTKNQWNSDFKEIDMLEWPIKADANPWTYYTTQHWYQGGHVQLSYPIDLRTIGITDDLTGFHTYGITITEQQLLFDIDGKRTAVMANRSPTSSWYVLLNMAMGGTWPGNPTAETTFPCDMILDWIRIYEPA